MFSLVHATASRQRSIRMPRRNASVMPLVTTRPHTGLTLAAAHGRAQKCRLDETGYDAAMDLLRVLTLNIWNRQGPWEERAKLIRRGLKELAPDLIGLQEVLHHDQEPLDQAQELSAGLGYHVAYASAWEIGGGLHLGNAILSRWPI